MEIMNSACVTHTSRYLTMNRYNPWTSLELRVFVLLVYVQLSYQGKVTSSANSHPFSGTLFPSMHS